MLGISEAIYVSLKGLEEWKGIISENPTFLKPREISAKSRTRAEKGNPYEQGIIDKVLGSVSWLENEWLRRSVTDVYQITHGGERTAREKVFFSPTYIILEFNVTHRIIER